MIYFVGSDLKRIISIFIIGKGNCKVESKDLGKIYQFVRAKNTLIHDRMGMTSYVIVNQFLFNEVSHY